MDDNKFMQEAYSMFKEHLDYEEVNRLRIVDITTGKLLNIDYSLIRFDSDLNFYKQNDDGEWIKVENPKFKTVIAKYEQFKNPE